MNKDRVTLQLMKGATVERKALKILLLLTLELAKYT